MAPLYLMPPILLRGQACVLCTCVCTAVDAISLFNRCKTGLKPDGVIMVRQGEGLALVVVVVVVSRPGVPGGGSSRAINLTTYVHSSRLVRATLSSCVALPA